MLKFPCLVLDHDDTVVQSEKTIGHPFFQMYLDRTRPGTVIPLPDYVRGCARLGFADMCREYWQFSEEELETEFNEWMDYSRCHIPDPYPGMKALLRKHKALGGRICVVSHSAEEIIRRDYKALFDMQPDTVYGWDLPEEKRKPSTYAIEDIMQRYGYTKEQLLIVDDLNLACTMAKKANVKIAFAGWSKEDLPEMAAEMESLCDYSFRTVAELSKFLFD